MEGRKEYKNQENYSQTNGADLKVFYQMPHWYKKAKKKLI